jgi:hypothetical protein
MDKASPAVELFEWRAWGNRMLVGRSVKLTLRVQM